MSDHTGSGGGTGGQAEANSGAGRSTRRVGVVLFLAAAALALTVIFFDPITLVALLLIAAAGIAALLRPLTRFWPKRPTLAGMLVGMGFWLGIVALLALMGLLLEQPIRDQLRQLPQIEQQTDQMLHTIGTRLGLDDPPTVRQILEPLLNWLIGELADDDGQFLARLADGIGMVIVGVALLVFGSVFILAESSGRIPDHLARLLPEHLRPGLHEALARTETRLRWWLLGILTSMAVVGVGAYVGFTIVGLEMALPLAILAGLAEIVPILGPTFAFLVALLFAATAGTTEVIGVLIVWAIIQVVEPYVIVPTVMRQAVRIPPLVTLFTVVLWARLLGPLGLILAIPINLIIWTCVEQFYLRQQ